MKTLMSPSERSDAAGEVRSLILASGQQAMLLRKQPGEDLYGSDDDAFGEIGTFALEIDETPPVDLGRKPDATASVLPELDIQPEDRIRYAGTDYRVQTVSEQQLFGAITHKVLELVKLHGS